MIYFSFLRNDGFENHHRAPLQHLQPVVLVLARFEARSLQDVRPEAAGHGQAQGWVARISKLGCG